MARAARDARDSVRVLARTGDTLVGELLHGQGTFFEWEHYPKGDVYDRRSHCQYYYHAHPASERRGEHGHFHTFVRPAGMPKGVKPAPLPDHKAPRKPNDALSHLIGISMDRRGVPIRLFTTNRWVTGETWYVARDACRLAARFEIDMAHPSWPVNRWLTAMFRLFRPQIVALLTERDRMIARWQQIHPRRNVHKDRRLEIVSEIAIDVDRQVRAIRRALRRRRA